MADQKDADELANQLENALDTPQAPDTARWQVFFALGYVGQEADDEVEEALGLIAEKVKDI